MRVLHHFQNELQYASESETGFVLDDFRIKPLDLVCHDAQTVNIGIRFGSDWYVVIKDPSWSAIQVLFEWLLVCYWFDRLVRDLNGYPHLNCSTEFAELFVKVLTTIHPGSIECLIEIWHRVR